MLRSFWESFIGGQCFIGGEFFFHWQMFHRREIRTDWCQRACHWNWDRWRRWGHGTRGCRCPVQKHLSSCLWSSCLPGQKWDLGPRRPDPAPLSSPEVWDRTWTWTSIWSASLRALSKALHCDWHLESQRWWLENQSGFEKTFLNASLSNWTPQWGLLPLIEDFHRPKGTFPASRGLSLPLEDLHCLYRGLSTPQGVFHCLRRSFNPSWGGRLVRSLFAAIQMNNKQKTPIRRVGYRSTPKTGKALVNSRSATFSSALPLPTGFACPHWLLHILPVKVT